MVRPLSALTSSKRVGAWILKVPRTIPSRCTTRGGGGSSTAAAGAVVSSVGALVAGVAGAAGGAGVSVGAATTGGASATVAVLGAGSAGVVASATGASCFRYCAATNANASAGGSISSHSPLAPISLTVSPCLRVPSTLKFSPGPPRTLSFFGRTVLLVASRNEELTHTWVVAGRTIFAQADGSSGPEFLSVTSSSTVTGSPLVK